MQKNKANIVITFIMMTTFLCFSKYILANTWEQFDSEESQLLSVFSWNVWFDDATGLQRYPKILDKALTSQSDIIFLQEVTPSFISAIHRHKISEAYHLTTSNDAQKQYGQAFLTRHRLLMKDEQPLESVYGRDVILGLYELTESHAVILINVHLESGSDNSVTRKQQVHHIQENLLPLFKEEVRMLYPEKQSLSVLWAGDFNFAEGESSSGLHDFSDTGKLFLNNTPTYDTAQNSLASSTSAWFEKPARLDRFFTLQKDKLVAVHYEVFNALPYTFLSDHFPIKAVFHFKTQNASTQDIQTRPK